MLDHRQVVAGGRLPAYPMNGNHSVEDVEFGFQYAVRSSCCENFGDEFCFQAKAEEEIGAYSPNLWKINSEYSPLLPCDHHYSNLSPPRTRLQAIAEGRRELMEMIKSMPESSYELSLKDIVDEQEKTREEKKEESTAVVHEQTSLRFETEDRIKKKKQNKKKKSNIKAGGGQISRSTSMESGNFLIKIFFPRCLSSKRKSRSTKNGGLKVSPRTSFEISEKDTNYKEQWIRGIFVAGSGKNCSGSGGSSSSSSKSSSSSTSSVARNYFSIGCWPFLKIMKSKATRQTGCIF